MSYCRSAASPVSNKPWPAIVNDAGALARSIGFGVIPVTLNSHISAASAWMRPNPESLSKPAGRMFRAVLCRVDSTWAGVMDGSACRINAATPAACGAAADVPKKLGKPSPSMSTPKNVVSAPSGATISGLFAQGSGVPSRVPAVLNRIGVFPPEEKNSRIGGLTPNSGVCA